VEDVLDYEEIAPEMAAHGEYFALRVKGSSMEPRMRDGDVVIVRKQADVNHDDTAIVLVNGNEATIKRVLKSEAGIMLAPNNPAYEPKFYSNKDIAELPVQIIGRVVELRAKF
jgi:repressor LexA